MTNSERKSSYFSKKYQEFINRVYDESLIDEVVELKNDCKVNNNLYYFYLFDIILADIYINLGKLDEALELMLKDYNMLENNKYTEIHIMVLERIIYVYITKQYYPSALRYAQEKKNYFINPSSDVINRWYLEMAYIHEALGERNRSLTELNAILENNPDDNMRIIALNNITKIYIDDGNITEALVHLGECFGLCVKVEDKNGEDYCNYLRAKIYRLQHNYKKAIIFFEKIFKRIENLDEDNFNYLNEYLSLLIETEEYNQAKKLCDKFIEFVSSNDDLYNKKLFYESYLKINIYLQTKRKAKKEKINNLFKLIEDLTKEIDENKDLHSNEVRDVELTFEVMNKSQATHNALKDLANSLQKVNSLDIKEILEKYSRVLEKICHISEITYFIFDHLDEAIIPSFIPNEKQIEVYNFKGNELNQKYVNYQDLNNSVIEMLFTGHNNIVIDFEDTPTNTIDPVSRLTYVDLKIRQLNAMSLYENKNLYGCVVYTSRNADINGNLNLLLIKTATQILEKLLLNCFKYSNINTQKELLNNSLKQSNKYFISNNILSNSIYLPDYLKDIIGLEKNIISFEEYEKFVEPIDITSYKEKYQAINEKKGYKVKYHLNINGEILFLSEECELDNSGNYYYGVLERHEFSNSITNNICVLEDLLKEVVNLKNKSLKEEFKFSTYLFKIRFNDFITLNNRAHIMNEVYQFIKDTLNTNVYLLDDLLVVISEKENNLNTVFNYLNKDFVLNEIVIKLKYSHLVVNYPDDFAKIDDLVELVYFINDYFTKENDPKEFTNDLYAKFIAYKTINDCVTKANNENLKFIFTKLVNNNTEVGYLAVPYIKGINSADSFNILSKEIKVKFDEKQIIALEKCELDNLYLSVSMQALKNLLITEKLPKNKKINFIIDDFTLDYVEVIKALRSLGYGVIVSGNELPKLTSELIIDYYINGVYNISGENKKYLDCLKDSVYLLTTNNQETFPNVILITKEVFK